MWILFYLFCLSTLEYFSWKFLNPLSLVSKNSAVTFQNVKPIWSMLIGSSGGRSSSGTPVSIVGRKSTRVLNIQSIIPAVVNMLKLTGQCKHWGLLPLPGIPPGQWRDLLEQWISRVKIQRPSFSNFSVSIFLCYLLTCCLEKAQSHSVFFHAASFSEQVLYTI